MDSHAVNDTPEVLTRPVAVVAGGTAGIGAAIARALDRDGYHVVVVGSRGMEEGSSVIAAFASATYIQADLMQPAAPSRVMAEVRQKFGRADVIVYAAGTTARIAHADIAAVTDDVWQQILDLNLLAPWRLVQSAQPLLRESKNGNVILVGALAGADVGGSSIPYAVSKAALHHMCKLLGGALGPEIRVNTVAPGFIETRWTDGEEWEGLRQVIEERAPLHRTGEPEEIAEVVLGLLRATYVTGQTIVADGGLSLVP